MGISEVIPEGITKVNVSCERMGVSTPERILENKSSGKIIFDLFLELIDKLSSGGEFCTETSEQNVELSTQVYVKLCTLKEPIR